MNIPSSILLQPPVVVGAAVRIAGGHKSASDLDEIDARRLRDCAGLTPHLWQRHGDAVLDAARQILAAK